MKILEIGNTFKNNKIRQIEFNSFEYFLDADILILDLNEVQSSFYKSFSFGQHTSFITQTKYDIFLQTFEKRREELRHYFKDGGNLFLSKGKQSVFKFKKMIGEQLIETTFDFLSLVDLDSEHFLTKIHSGENMAYSEGIFADFFKNYYCYYEYSYSKFKGYPVASISRTGETVAICTPKDKGNIIFLPEIAPAEIPGENSFFQEDRIRTSIETLDKQLKEKAKEIKAYTVPDWAKIYLLGEEEKELGTLDVLQKQAIEIQEKIQNQLDVLESFDKLKLLLFESGKNLEAVVEQIFKELGYDLLEIAPNRDDLIIRHQDDIAVLEIKGVGGSAAEKHAAQLGKWTNEYHLKHEILPKGILIVNTFRDKPLEERTEDDFPNQMLKYSKQMNFCLLSTTTLLGLYLSFKAGDIAFEVVHQQLFDTVGVLQYESSLIRKKSQLLTDV